MIELVVSDDGGGLAVPPEEALGRGVGLANTKARLEQLYGPSHRFQMGSGEQGGFEITLAFPFRPEKPPAAAGA